MAYLSNLISLLSRVINRMGKNHHSNSDFFSDDRETNRIAQEELNEIATINNEDFSEIANEEDVYNCYRLLLGRKPDSEGWNTWLSNVKGKNVSIKTLVSGFLCSPEFKNSNFFTFGQNTQYELVSLNTFKIYVPVDDWAVGKTILEQKIYEPHVTQIIHQVLSSGMVFVDIGANIGYFSLMAAELVGTTGKVFSFEPSQQNCKCLYLSTKINNFDNIELYPFAVAEKKTTFFYDSLGTNGITSEVDEQSISLNSRLLVRSVILDEILSNVEHIDVIKIDIEGAEFRAIQGATKILQRHRPIILSEFSPPALQSISKISGEEYLQKLMRENYFISVIKEDEIIECANDTEKIIKVFENHRSSHIDIIAYPH